MELLRDHNKLINHLPISLLYSISLIHSDYKLVLKNLKGQNWHFANLQQFHLFRQNWKEVNAPFSISSEVVFLLASDKKFPEKKKITHVDKLELDNDKILWNKEYHKNKHGQSFYVDQLILKPKRWTLLIWGKNSNKKFFMKNIK